MTRTGLAGAALAGLLLSGSSVIGLPVQGIGAAAVAFAQTDPDTTRPAAVNDLSSDPPPPGTGRTAVYAGNPRYLQDAPGAPFLLVGFGNEAKNRPAVLDLLAGKISYQRAYAAAWDRRMDPSAYEFGRPWPTVGGRADMEAWNETYWDNLRDYLENARRRSITVGLTLWDGHSDLPGGKFGEYSIWNADGNVQGVQWAYDAGALTLYPNPRPTGGARERLVYYQRRWVDRLLQEIAPFPNVILELDNETDLAAPEWWLWWAGHILASGPYVIATTWNASYTIPDPIFASDPRLHMKSYHDRSDAVITSQRWSWEKVVVADGDVSCANLDAGTARRLAWRSVLRGGHWNDFVCADQPFPDQVKIAYYGHLLDFVRTRVVPLWDMEPRDDLVSSGLAMARPGSHYLVYTESDVVVDLSAVAGTVRWEWYDPRTGAAAASGEVAGAAAVPFTLPGSGDYALWISAVEEPVRRPASLGVRAPGSSSLRGWRRRRGRALSRLRSCGHTAPAPGRARGQCRPVPRGLGGRGRRRRTAAPVTGSGPSPGPSSAVARASSPR